MPDGPGHQSGWKKGFSPPTGFSSNDTSRNDATLLGTRLGFCAWQMGISTKSNHKMPEKLGATGRIQWCISPIVFCQTQWNTISAGNPTWEWKSQIITAWSIEQGGFPWVCLGEGNHFALSKDCIWLLHPWSLAHDLPLKALTSSHKCQPSSGHVFSWADDTVEVASLSWKQWSNESSEQHYSNNTKEKKILAWTYRCLNKQIIKVHKYLWTWL